MAIRLTGTVAASATCPRHQGKIPVPQPPARPGDVVMAQRAAEKLAAEAAERLGIPMPQRPKRPPAPRCLGCVVEQVAAEMASFEDPEDLPTGQT